MIKNYLKASLAALWRRKWFSLLTLFSIAISLVVVTCGASMWNMISAPLTPEVHKDRTFFLQPSEQNILPPKFFFEKINVQHTAELFCIYDVGGFFVVYKQNKVKKFNICQTDNKFFKIFDFEFVDGKPYSSDLSDTDIRWCIISDNLANYYFESTKCKGQIIDVGNLKARVSGVYKKQPGLSELTADIYYRIDPQYYSGSKWNPRFEVAFLCRSAKDGDRLQTEINHLALSSGEKPFPPGFSVKMVKSHVKYLYRFFNFDQEGIVVLIVLSLIVIILPVLCLIDILKSNTENRSEELGIRKVFGATAKRIRGQLLFENIFVTLLGGILGLILSFIFFSVLSEENFSRLFLVFFDWHSFGYYLLVFVFIGLLAGVIPSYQLSKVSIVHALKNS